VRKLLRALLTSSELVSNAKMMHIKTTSHCLIRYQSLAGKGVALRMLNILIDKAKEKGVTEISLDATELGKPLYKKCKFVESEECMVLNLK